MRFYISWQKRAEKNDRIKELDISKAEKNEINYEELCEDIRYIYTGQGKMNAHKDDDREKLEKGDSYSYSLNEYGDGYILKDLDAMDAFEYDIYLEKNNNITKDPGFDSEVFFW